MVLHKRAGELYSGVEALVRSHLQAVELTLTAAMEQHDTFLKCLKGIYRDHDYTMIRIRDILLYMDRSSASSGRKPIYDLGLDIFDDQLLSKVEIADFLRVELLAMITAERSGERTNRVLFRETTAMLMALGVADPNVFTHGARQSQPARDVYEKTFEKRFLEQSGAYFQRVAQEILSSNNAEIVLQRVENCIAQEKKLVEHCLDPSSMAPLMKLLDSELIEKHVDAILDLDVCSIVEMLNNTMVKQLKMMYHFLGRVSTGGKKMSTRIHAHLAATGKRLVEQAAATEGSKMAVKMVGDVLKLKAQYDELLCNAFQNDKTFKIDIYSGLEDVVNTDARFPELLSLFIDHVLKKGVKEMTEREVESSFDQAIQLFRLLREKDVFERYYKLHLNKRLLSSKSASDEAERGVIERLKKECGNSYTYKLEQMIKDIQTLSTEATAEFHKKHGPALSKLWNGRSFNVRVLTSVHWSSERNSSYTLPSDLQAVQDAFTQFYCKEKHQGRSLKWSPAAATFDLDAHFDGFKRKHTISGSMYQGLVLLAFNEMPATGKYTFRELVEKVGLSDSDTKRCLGGLSLGKFKLLKKNPMSKTFSDGDTFWINEEFQSKYARIKLHQVAVKDGAAERQSTRAKVESDRRYQIEACIVRVMKARRNMKHNDLIVEVVNQLSSRFTPAPPVLKKRIEHLIEREYMSRDPTDRNLYTYVA